MKTRTGQKLKLTTVEELLGVPATESSTEIDVDMIHVFKNHPFKVLDDEKMSDLVESIRVNGILSPVLVRPDGEDSYEMISGHRRMHAAKIVGLTMIPAIVREMSDDEAVIYMVDSNIQREELLPSEKAFAFKMKLDAMKRQGKRTDLTSDQNVQKFQTSRDSLASEFGISGPQISRYIRLTELIPDLLELVDNKRLQMTAAVEISYVDKEIQQWICEYIHENGNVKQNQIVILRQELLNGAITQSQLIDILNENAIGRIPKKKVTLSEKKLSQYFPPHYTSAEMEKVIVELLTNWKEQGGAENGF
ncbi:MAG: ParB/RepB/Spo0J family partition protein [Bariatricus sp.]|uniref:ParB/RepB/Spo0J family partition protein n=1 Tax=Bariatricus sp. HCP3S3_E12 TaxID=3438906 RepID=UPI002A86B3C8|nr:ParB/RepB/Spo0J family partition protein [Bariatricus sp.]